MLLGEVLEQGQVGTGSTSILLSVTYLQVALREGDLRSEDELVALLGELDRVTKLARLAVNLDAVVEELLEGGGIEDVVVGGDRVVNVELVEGLARVLGRGSGLGLNQVRKKNMLAFLLHRVDDGRATAATIATTGETKP